MTQKEMFFMSDKATRRRIASLKSARQMWLRASSRELHFDYCLNCSHTTPDPGCEGCCAKQFRATRVTEIENEIRQLTGDSDVYRPTKPKSRNVAEQLPLFA